MPSHHPSYALRPGRRIEVVIEQADGGRALVVGKLDKVPDAAGGVAMRIVVSNSTITPLPAQPRRPAAGTSRDTPAEPGE